MSWDPVWEHIFTERASWGYYPPEELVRYEALLQTLVERRGRRPPA